VLRILRLKDRLGILADPFVDGGPLHEAVDLPSHRALAARIAARSITLVRANAGTLPLRRGDRVLATGADSRATAALATELRRNGFSVSLWLPGTPVSTWAAFEAGRLARVCDASVVATKDIREEPSQLALVDAVLDGGRRVTVVSLGDPQDIARLPGVRSYLAAYNGKAPSLRAVADALTGRVAVTGRLPVAIVAPGRSRTLYPIGTGIQMAAQDE
jgi:beta-N-acetylhexosaminidase